jgi:hypothetical protein
MKTSNSRVRTPRAPLAVPVSVAILGLLAACASVPLPEREGVVLYRKKCGACHRPYAPQEIRVSDFDKTFALMAARAKLTPEEAAVIRRYLEPDLLPAHPVTASSR